MLGLKMGIFKKIQKIRLLSSSQLLVLFLNVAAFTSIFVNILSSVVLAFFAMIYARKLISDNDENYLLLSSHLKMIAKNLVKFIFYSVSVGFCYLTLSQTQYMPKSEVSLILLLIQAFLVLSLTFGSIRNICLNISNEPPAGSFFSGSKYVFCSFPCFMFSSLFSLLRKDS